MSKIGIGDSAHKAQDVGGGAGTRQSPRSNLHLMDIANAEEDEDEEEEEDEDHVVRAIFEDNLRKAGLEMELEPSRVSELANTCTEMGFDGNTFICWKPLCSHTLISVICHSALILNL